MLLKQDGWNPCEFAVKTILHKYATSNILHQQLMKLFTNTCYVKEIHLSIPMTFQTQKVKMIKTFYRNMSSLTFLCEEEFTQKLELLVKATYKAFEVVPYDLQ